jgi:hypothetical protein
MSNAKFASFNVTTQAKLNDENLHIDKKTKDRSPSVLPQTTDSEKEHVLQ